MRLCAHEVVSKCFHKSQNENDMTNHLTMPDGNLNPKGFQPVVAPEFSRGGAMFPDGGLYFFSWLGTVGQIFVSFPRQMYKFSPTGRGGGLALPDKGDCSPPAPPLSTYRRAYMHPAGLLSTSP